MCFCQPPSRAPQVLPATSSCSHHNSDLALNLPQLHLQGICSPTSIPISLPEYHCPAPNKYPSGQAKYGIYGAGLVRSLFRRLQINSMARDGAIFWQCWYNRIEDSTIWGNGIGLHSACNNMRVTGSDLHANTITGILIDGGAAVDIVGNLIEGNAGWAHPIHPPIHSRTYCVVPVHDMNVSDLNALVTARLPACLAEVVVVCPVPAILG